MEINGASNITSCSVYVWVMKGGEKSKSQENCLRNNSFINPTQ